MRNSQFSYSAGEDGTPLTCAANKGHVNILNYLLGQNANVNGDTKVSIQLVNYNNNFYHTYTYVVKVITPNAGFQKWT